MSDETTRPPGIVLPEAGMELGRPPSAPEFDPHEGREFGGEAEPMISTLVFVGLDEGGDFEDAVNEIINFAESRSLLNLSASIGPTHETIYNAVSKLGIEDGDEEEG